MKKKFLNITAINSRLSEVKKVSIGIITLFISAVAPVAMVHADNLYVSGQQVPIEVVEHIDSESFELNNTGAVTFHMEPNLAVRPSTAAMVIIDDAFEEFVNSEGEEMRCLQPLKNEIKEAFRRVDIQKARVSGRLDEGYLNISMLLPENLLLSVNSLKDFDAPGIVSFNLFRIRELLVSDIIPLDHLVRYIEDVESKLR